MKILILADQAKVDLQRLDRNTRLRFLAALQRLGSTGAGNLKKLQTIRINPVQNRSEVYR